MQKLKYEVRQRIIRAGAMLFKTNGFENTSMKDIAKNAEISTGNIYRYFLTKHHLLSEMQSDIEREISTFFYDIPESYKEVDCENLYNEIKNKIVELAISRGEDLDIMFKCAEQGLFREFEAKMLSEFTKKIMSIGESINNKKVDAVICGALACSIFEGFAYIVRTNIHDTLKLERDLDIFYKITLANIDKRIIEVVQNDR